MSEYYITKRERCPAMYDDESDRPAGICVQCNGTGYIETQVDADEWLEERLQDARILRFLDAWINEPVTKEGNKELQELQEALTQSGLSFEYSENCKECPEQEVQ